MISDTRHDVLAIFALGIHHEDRIDDLHRGEIAKIGRHGGRSHIDRQSVSPLGLTGSEADNFLVVPYTDRYVPIAVTQCRGQLP